MAAFAPDSQHRPRRRLVAWLRATPAILLALGAAAIAAGTIVYFTDDMPPFLVEKLPLPHEALWLFAVRVHVVTAVLALPACLVLSGPLARSRWRALHRWLGRVTALLVLACAVPSGAYLALFAKGGFGASLGFWLSGAITAVAMVEAIRSARAGDFARHRRAAQHVLAQLAVAVTSRAMLVAAAALALDETRAYLVSLWLPVVGHALAVEARHLYAALRRRNPHALDPDAARPVPRLPRVRVSA